MGPTDWHLFIGEGGVVGFGVLRMLSFLCGNLHVMAISHHLASPLRILLISDVPCLQRNSGLFRSLGQNNTLCGDKKGPDYSRYRSYVNNSEDHRIHYVAGEAGRRNCGFLE